MKRLEQDFFARDAQVVARALVGCELVHRTPAGELRLRITETEAYCGEADTACHAHKGRTKRTEVMYGPAGDIYIYLCYGMHWLLNIVTGQSEDPQAVLIRACAAAPGPARLTKALHIDGSLNRGSVLAPDSPLWVEGDGSLHPVVQKPRVGIGYASPEDQARLWRYCLDESPRL